MILRVLELLTARVFLLTILDPVVEHVLVSQIVIALGGAGLAVVLRHWLPRVRSLAFATAGLTFAGGIAWLSASQLAYAVFWRQECPGCIDRFPESYDAVWWSGALARSSMDALVGAIAAALLVVIVTRLAGDSRPPATRRVPA